MDDRRLDGLVRLYDEHLSQAQQHEELRAQATSILSAIAAGVAGFAGIDGLTRSDVPAGMLVTLVALLGVLISLKHYERYRYHAFTLDLIQEEIDKPPGESRMAPAAVKFAAESGHRSGWSLRSEYRKHRTLYGDERPASVLTAVRLHLLWAALPAAIGLAGIVITVLSAW